ncbi:2-oxo acid dehydrogenase subunit E2 [Psychrobacter sp. FDAARGOS_221]|uniref:2-oxo acid dehydrogenase subunit E2 n=1 Tax=Psychrobacter sp. FDAARGOS_221 TaxID=1975705 RepID=UPI000BB58CF5|nr:2-oxo acid dehydrogenase subunit E2 [Psychrobacter sp. FDAARGOS_221]PNK61773.1 pyruvate dehydrogenase complex dihydrolipoyllysine-residue acetyltransferase [Psychrobacter sp. FDAARGOS_221]
MQIKAPDLGVDSAEVSEILVSVGDVITEDDNLVLLESDKAAVEVPSSAKGKVTKISVSVGDTVSEGTVLIELEADDASDADTSSDTSSDAGSEADKDTKQQAQQQASAKDADTSEPTSIQDESKSSEQVSSSQTYSLPDLGVDEAMIAEIMVSVGDSVDADQSILLVESDKASVEVPSPVAGTIEEILVSTGDTIANGQDYIVIKSTQAAAGTTDTAAADEAPAKTESKEQADKQNTAEPKKQAAPAQKTQQSQNKLSESEVNAKLTDVYAGPAVRKLARQLGVDITQVSGSAINDRIVKEDLFDFVKTQLKEQPKAAAAGSVAGGSGLPSLPDMSNADIWGEIETQDLSRLQKVSIPQLNYNTYLPQVTQFDLSDITETEKLRGELKGEFKAQGIGLTILAFIVKATAYALTQHPKFNSHLSDDNTQIIIRKTVNMGIAVATDDGLIVPVIKNVQDKGIKQIAIEIGELAAKARDKKLGAKDLQGASFTISSQGNLGGTYFTPLVNWPQVGILGISEATMQPRWNAQKQSFEPRLMLPLSLSYDHRVINGADAAVFTRYIAKLLADPRRILL